MKIVMDSNIIFSALISGKVVFVGFYELSG